MSMISVVTLLAACTADGSTSVIYSKTRNACLDLFYGSFQRLPPFRTMYVGVPSGEEGESRSFNCFWGAGGSSRKDADDTAHFECLKRYRFCFRLGDETGLDPYYASPVQRY